MESYKKDALIVVVGVGVIVLVLVAVLVVAVTGNGGPLVAPGDQGIVSAAIVPTAPTGEVEKPLDVVTIGNRSYMPFGLRGVPPAERPKHILSLIRSFEAAEGVEVTSFSVEEGILEVETSSMFAPGKRYVRGIWMTHRPRQGTD